MGFRVGLALHPRRDASTEVGIVQRWAASHGAEVLVRHEDAPRCPSGVRGVTEDEMSRTADWLVTLGGDGTMLGALRLAAHRPIPVLGVNLGNVGFLVEIEPEELPAALDRLEAGQFEVERRSCLWATVGNEQLVAFNDLAVSRVPGTGPISARLSIAGRRHGGYRCDAVVVSTPTGSTAYNYAAGGPVVSPGLEAVLVTPVAPMMGIDRPVVVSPEEPLRLEFIQASGQPALEMDGRFHGYLDIGGRIDIQLRTGAGLLVRLDPSGHHRRNQIQLSLLDLPLLPEELREARGLEP